MAVITRKRSGGVVAYYVKFKGAGPEGRDYWELAGRDKRHARSLNAQRRREMKDGAFQPKLSSTPTVLAFAEDWLGKRRIRSAEDEAFYLREYVLSKDWLTGLRMVDVRKVHMRRLYGELQGAPSLDAKKNGRPIAPRTADNIYGIVSSMFAEAEADEVIPASPCKLKRKTRTRRIRNKRAPYDAASIVRLLSAPNVHPAAKMFAALALFTGMREGEVCARRWRDLDRGAPGLWCLDVNSQYEDQPLKTDDGEQGEHARKVPVHPKLQALLAAWWTHGFELVYARKPTLDERIVPSFGQGRGRIGRVPRERAMGTHTKSSAYKMWRTALERAGVVNLSLHSTRHTFITLCRRGGADTEVVETITHNAAGNIVDQYTHRQWDELCRAVLCFGVVPSVGVLQGVTDSKQLPFLSVEAPGIEHASETGTDGNSSESAPSDEPPEPPAFTGNRPLLPAKRDARHPLPPGLVAVRLELPDGQVERLVPRRSDTVESLAARALRSAKELGGRLLARPAA